MDWSQWKPLYVITLGPRETDNSSVFTNFLETEMNLLQWKPLIVITFRPRETDNIDWITVGAAEWDHG